MSEAEKRRRAEYKANRKKWIFIQTVIIALVSIFALTSAFTYYQINKTYYIDYTESSEVDYSVQLAPNDYYEEEWVGKDKAYVSALIKDIKANFKYALNINASAGVQYSYSYDIEAVLRIADKYSGAVIYEPVTVLVPKQVCTQSGGKDLVIPQEVTVNYAEYNAKAKSFINTYGLKNADCALVLTMKVNVTGSCDEFADEAQNTYFTSLSFPLATETSEPVVTSSVTNGETKVLACSSTVNKTVFFALSVILGALDVIAVAVIVCFIYTTRNEDINYTIKVQKIFKNYRSYIQQITNVFDTADYQILTVGTFNDMLSIRDTIQSPILMCENDDQTRTSFMIPTNTKILYVFDIKVENYDELYYTDEEEAAVSSEIIEASESEEKA